MSEHQSDRFRPDRLRHRLPGVEPFGSNSGTATNRLSESERFFQRRCLIPAGIIHDNASVAGRRRHSDLVRRQRRLSAPAAVCRPLQKPELRLLLLQLGG